MKSLLQKGDVLVVSDLTRLARATLLIDEFTSQGIDWKSVKEAWFDTTGVQRDYLLAILQD